MNKSKNIAIVAINDLDRVFALNATAGYFLGCNEVRVLGQKITDALKDFPDLLRFYKEERQFGEFVAGNKGQEKNYEVYVSPLTAKRSRSLDRVMVINDITERSQAQMLLIQKQQSLAVIKERERLARELHDDLSQVLGFICVQTQAIHKAISSGQNLTANKHLKRLIAVAQDAQREIRDYILNVKTTASLEQDFLPALEQYLKHFSQNYDIPLELIAEGVSDRNILPDVRIQLPRIIQEALNNVRKHANARQVRVIIESLGKETICVTIEDDGCGFDTGITLNKGRERFGLKIMAERAQDAGCSLHIDSKPNRGTRVTIRIPIERSS